MTVPTRNSAKTLKACLEAVYSSTYPRLEVIVVDGGSCDATLKVAEEYGARVVSCSWGLLGARFTGFKEARGDYILLLDSDQLVEASAIERAVEASRIFDMLVLEEMGFEPRSLFERLFAYDRELAHRVPSLDPIGGEVLPRFFKRWVLEAAFSRIPRRALEEVVHFDHAIIYYEAYSVTQRVGVVPRAVWHLESASPREVVVKNVRYGSSLNSLLKLRKYRRLLCRDSLPKKVVNRARYGAGLVKVMGSLAINAFRDAAIAVGLVLGALHLR